MRGLLKKINPGFGLWRLYQYPRSVILDGHGEGYVDAALKFRGRAQMMKAAAMLPPFKAHGRDDALEMHFMTGSRFWYQTCFCIYSLVQNTDAPIRPIILDDGTLEQSHIETFRRIFPDVKIDFRVDVEARMDEHLPADRFPVLRRLRVDFPMIRKLIDPRIGYSGGRLHLDSDMIFYKRPTFLLDWLKNPQRPCYMRDYQSAYGYSDELLNSVIGIEVPSQVNAGISGLRSEDIEWEQVETWCKALTESEGVNHFLEQTLTAMIVAFQSGDIAPADEYVLRPTREEVINPTVVMHHYVDRSRAWYYRFAWRHVMRDAANPKSHSAETGAPDGAANQVNG